VARKETSVADSNAPSGPPSAEGGARPEQAAAPVQPAVEAKGKPAHEPSSRLHEVRFVAYPKLLFVWPLLLAGFVFWPLGSAPQATSVEAFMPVVGQATQPTAVGALQSTTIQRAAPASPRLEVLGWIYIWIAVIVLLTIGVDVDRNHAVFWLVLVAGLWVLGMYLRDVKHFTLFGDIYRWFASLDVQYDRNFGLAMSLLLLIPYIIMLAWARVNDCWRITHNEFEHYAWGKMDDSLGRGAKTIRSDFPDVFELLLGMAGTLIVYNATGTKELRRISNIVMLPLVRRRLNIILEKMAITQMAVSDEEEDEDQP
jgi:hypothetical protein